MVYKPGMPCRPGYKHAWYTGNGMGYAYYALNTTKKLDGFCIHCGAPAYFKQHQEGGDAQG